MSRTVKRGTPPRRPLSRVQPKRRPKPKVSHLDRLLAKLPVGEETLKRWATRGILAAGGAALLAGASYAGVPAMLGTALGEAAGRAGFRYDEVQAPGVRNMKLSTISAIVDEQKTRSLALIDLGEIRRRLLEQGWVADAQVSRRYPNKILVRITERKPAAVWQHQGQLKLIAADGALLDEVDRDAIPDLPLLIGPAAYLQAPRYAKLLDAAPALKPRVRAATWIGNQQWNLLMDSGETIKLPAEGAEAALLDFAKRDGAHGLLGRGWVIFDLRFFPEKLVARKPKGGAKTVTDPGDAEVKSTADGEIAETGTEG
jgi:cell division protein FtsQ